MKFQHRKKIEGWRERLAKKHGSQKLVAEAAGISKDHLNSILKNTDKILSGEVGLKILTYEQIELAMRKIGV